MKNLDEQVSKWIYDRAHASPVLTLLAKFGATYAIVVMVAAALYALLRVNDVPLFFIPFFTVLLIAWGITLALQFLVRRKRPFECLIYESKVKLFCRTPSFPSAHATIAFVVAAMTLHNAFFPLFVLAAVWICLSRVAVGVHYISDVIVGAIIGTSVVVLFPLFLFFLLER